jgi:hypothetical protein
MYTFIPLSTGVFQHLGVPQLCWNSTVTPGRPLDTSLAVDIYYGYIVYNINNLGIQICNIYIFGWTKKMNINL